MTADGSAAVKGAGGASDQPAQSASELKQLGKYQIEKKLGAGGMGTVYLARDRELKRVVALKVLPRDKAQNPTLVRRFKAEAQAAAQLRHDNIVAVYDSGESDGYLYIAMEYVEGQDLFEMVSRRGVVPVKRSIEIIKQVASALQHAFEQNIVHRDIKPSNLLIRRDFAVKLTDLGLARSVDDTLETNITRAGTTVGTVDYMSPEQARNSKLADIRSDLYSLGCTWYQMLTGEPPYPEGSLTNKLQAHAIKPIPDPRDKNEKIPEGLTAVLQRLMAKKPEDRYQTPAELIDDLNNSMLTSAGVSREIFADLSDYDQKALSDVDEEQEGGGDVYYDDDAADGGRETPPDGIPENGRRYKKIAKVSHETEGQRETETRDGRSKGRDAGKDASVEEARRRFPKHNAVPTETRSRDTRQDVAPSEMSPAEESRRRHPKKDVAPSETKSRDGKKDTTAVDNSSKAKSHKPLPPKRQPVEEQSQPDKKALSQDAVKYLAAIAGVIVAIGGLGWLIGAFSGHVGFDVNPFAAPPGPQPVNPAIVSVPGPQSSPKTGHHAPGSTPGGANTDATTNIGSAATSTANPSNVPSVFDVEKLPAWAMKEVEPSGPPILTVGTGAKTSTHYPLLEEAIRAAAPAGAILKLQGNGPFPLPFVEVSGVKRLAIMAAAPQDRPVIVLKPAEGQTTAGIRLVGGILELRGVHFSLDRTPFATAVKAVEVVDGQLFAADCSFTATGPDTISSAAMVSSSTQDSTAVPIVEPIVFVNRVVVRGDGLKGLIVDRANVDAVVKGSLLATGSAAALEVTGRLTADVVDIVTVKPRRIVRVVQSTLCSRRSVFDLSDNGASAKPPTTEIVLVDSLCCAQGVSENSSLVAAAGWPLIKSTNEGWLPRLKWTSKASLYLGFEQLIDLGSESQFKVSDAAGWQRVWNAKYDIKQFHKLTFPGTSLANLSAVQPEDFDAASLSYREVKASTGGLPGSPVEKLSVPDSTSQQRTAAVAQRPRLPAIAVKPGEPTLVKKVDLKKEDLGIILNKNDWPSGTLFEASGNGLCLMTPAKVEGKALRVIFRQADGVALKLQQKVGDGKAGDVPALFSISRGSLELTNAVLECPATKAATPAWLIQSSEATLILNGCRLQGTEIDGPLQQGLIRWTTAPPTSPAAEPPTLVCRDSYLAGIGCGIRVESGQGHVILRNSILAIRGEPGHALDLRPSRVSNNLLTAIDAEHVTFSASGAAICVQAAPGTDTVGAPMKLFVERCAIVPPLVFKAGESAGATLLKCAGPVLDTKQIEWWGTSNGVAKQVSHFIQRDGDSASASDQTGLAAWRQAWDKANDLRLLTGDKGVYLAVDLPNKWKDLRPGSFELHRSSQGATWADGGKPIGANVRGVEDLSVAKKGSGETPTTKPGSPNNKTTSPSPTTKKNVGF